MIIFNHYFPRVRNLNANRKNIFSIVFTQKILKANAFRIFSFVP